MDFYVQRLTEFEKDRSCLRKRSEGHCGGSAGLQQVGSSEVKRLEPQNSLSGALQKSIDVFLQDIFRSGSG